MATTPNRDSVIKVNLSDLQKDLRGIVYQTLHAEVEKFNLKEYIDKYIINYIKKHGNKIVQRYVYSFMEEAEIVLSPASWNKKEEKISLNTFMIKIIREVIENRIQKEMEKIDVIVKKKPSTKPEILGLENIDALIDFLEEVGEIGMPNGKKYKFIEMK